MAACNGKVNDCAHAASIDIGRQITKAWSDVAEGQSPRDVFEKPSIAEVIWKAAASQIVGANIQYRPLVTTMGEELLAANDVTLQGLKAALQTVAQWPCLLCQSPPAYAAIYIPTTSKAAGAVLTPPDKQRLIAYSLCAECKAEPDVTRRVELKIETDMRALNYRAN